MRKRILIRLDRLNAASAPAQMNLPGFDFHALKGFVPTRYSVHVNGPWCITFEFYGGGPPPPFFLKKHQGGKKTGPYKAKTPPNRCPTHPGELLSEVIPATGKSKTEIAALLGISRQHLYDILAQRKPVSPAVAVRLGKLFGDGAGVWVRMQGAYDTWHAERELADEIRKIPRLKAVAA